MLTKILYIVTIVAVALLSYTAQKRDNRKLFLVGAIILSLLAGLRGESVGIDTKNYIELFDIIGEGRLNRAYGLEITFKYICAILLKIVPSNNFLFFFFAMATNTLIFLRYWDLRKMISLPWAVITYYGVFYFMTFNIIRQFIAIAIVFYGTRYLAKKRYGTYIVSVLIAMLIHKSAILGFGFIFFEIFVWGLLEKIQKKYIKIMLTVAPFAAVVAVAWLLSRYINYFSKITLNIGVMLIIKLGIFLLTCMLVRNCYKNQVDSNGYSEQSYTFITVRVYYLAGIMLAMLGYFFQFMDRVSLVFYIFETVYIAMMMKSKEFEPIAKLLPAALFLLLCFITVMGNSQGQGEYVFFWQ